MARPRTPPPDAAVSRPRPEVDALPETMPTPQPSRHGHNAEGRFPGPEAFERDARVHDRPRCPAPPQVRRRRGGAVLHGACADGEPKRPRRAGRADAGPWPCRAARGPRHDPCPFAGLHAAPDARGADKGCDGADFVRDLRQACVTPHVAPQGPSLGHLWPHHPARGPCPVPEAPQAHRGALRLGQDRRRHGPDRPSWARTGPRPLHPDDGRGQPGPTAQAAGPVTPRRRIRWAYPPHRGSERQAPPAPKGKNRPASPTSSAAC